MENNTLFKRKKILKKIARLATIAALSLLVLMGILWVVTLFLKRERIPTRVVDKNITFSSVNYDIDIFEDPIYAGKQRNITFLEYGTGSIVGENFTGEGAWRGIVPEEEYAKAGAAALFFRNYFICLISGDYGGYPEFFTENFFKYYSLPKKFTCQKIYDITVELYGRDDIDLNGETAVMEHYIVSYKIMNNNASFRGDVGSDLAKPLYFKILTHQGSMKIEAITFIKEKKA